MKTLCLVLIAILSISTVANCRAFTKCELAQELYYKHNFVREDLAEWVCLVQSESNYVTSMVGGPNSNGSFDWGLFQINDNYWCGVGIAAKDCNIDCNNLIDDDITDDVACVQIIYARHNWTAWNGWKAKCQGDFPSVDDCF